jgi:hypothetical protein
VEAGAVEEEEVGALAAERALCHCRAGDALIDGKGAPRAGSAVKRIRCRTARKASTVKEGVVGTK